MLRLARQGDVSGTITPALPGKGKFTDPVAGAATGNWEAGVPELTLVRTARSAGLPVVSSASCTFTFVGKQVSSPNNPVRGTSKVTLNPDTHILRVAGRNVLVEGNKAQDNFGNQVVVNPSALFRTT